LPYLQNYVSSSFSLCGLDGQYQDLDTIN
jgi:hypothetical protein